MNEISQLSRIIEGALFAANKPLSIDQVLALFPEEQLPEKQAIKDALAQLQADYENRGIELKEIASGFQFQVRPDLSQWVSRLWEERPPRYSRALLETLALVAYRQPITRGEIEEVRGVVVSTNIMRTLVEREWVRVVGHKDVPGHPSLYATTKQFLDYFGLKRLEDLPPLAELADIDAMGKNLEQQLSEEDSAEGEDEQGAQEEGAKQQDNTIEQQGDAVDVESEEDKGVEQPESEPETVESASLESDDNSTEDSVTKEEEHEEKATEA